VNHTKTRHSLTNHPSKAIVSQVTEDVDVTQSESFARDSNWTSVTNDKEKPKKAVRTTNHQEASTTKINLKATKALIARSPKNPVVSSLAITNQKNQSKWFSALSSDLPFKGRPIQSIHSGNKLDFCRIGTKVTKIMESDLQAASGVKRINMVNGLKSVNQASDDSCNDASKSPNELRSISKLPPPRINIDTGKLLHSKLSVQSAAPNIISSNSRPSSPEVEHVMRSTILPSWKEEGFGDASPRSNKIEVGLKPNRFEKSLANNKKQEPGFRSSSKQELGTSNIRKSVDCLKDSKSFSPRTIAAHVGSALVVKSDDDENEQHYRRKPFRRRSFPLSPSPTRKQYGKTLQTVLEISESSSSTRSSSTTKSSLKRKILPQKLYPNKKQKLLGSNKQPKSKGSTVETRTDQIVFQDTNSKTETSGNLDKDVEFNESEDFILFDTVDGSPEIQQLATNQSERKNKNLDAAESNNQKTNAGQPPNSKRKNSDACSEIDVSKESSTDFSSLSKTGSKNTTSVRQLPPLADWPKKKGVAKVGKRRAKLFSVKLSPLKANRASKGPLELQPWKMSPKVEESKLKKSREEVPEENPKDSPRFISSRPISRPEIIGLSFTKLKKPRTANMPPGARPSMPPPSETKSRAKVVKKKKSSRKAVERKSEKTLFQKRKNKKNNKKPSFLDPDRRIMCFKCACEDGYIWGRTLKKRRQVQHKCPAFGKVITRTLGQVFGRCAAKNNHKGPCLTLVEDPASIGIFPPEVITKRMEKEERERKKT